MTARHSVANHSGVFDLDQIFASRNRDSYMTGVIRASETPCVTGSLISLLLDSALRSRLLFRCSSSLRSVDCTDTPKLAAVGSEALTFAE